jgi:hypothetical protein
MDTQTLEKPRLTQFSIHTYDRSSPHDLRQQAKAVEGKYKQTAKELRALADWKEEQLFTDPKRLKLINRTRK